MTTYRVTWILQNGEKEHETFIADTFLLQPNGIAVFVQESKVGQIDITVPGAAPEQPQGTALGMAAGFNSVKIVEG